MDDVHRYAAGLGGACAVQNIGPTWMELNPYVGSFVDNKNLVMKCKMFFYSVVCKKKTCVYLFILSGCIMYFWSQLFKYFDTKLYCTSQLYSCSCFKHEHEHNSEVQ